MVIERHNVPVSQLTTFQNVGQVPRLLIFDDMAELQTYIRKGEPYYILGRGSNTVIDPSEEFPTIIQLSPHYQPPTLEGNVMYVGAGVTVSQLMNLSKETGFSGLEFMAGVPASVGGMVAMNFGCWGKEISDMLVSVDVMKDDGEIVTMSPSDLEFAYRFSTFQEEPWIVLGARIAGSLGDKEVVKKTILNAIQKRLDSQPLRDKTFGSVFRNPSGNFAGQLLETYGFKGYELGPVRMSEKHANFMVNRGDATFADALKLIEKIQQEIKMKRGISLALEVKLVA